MNSHIKKILSTLSTVFIISQAQADTSVPVYQNYDGNLLYAPYEIIPDHPQCSGPDKIAFRAQLTAEDANFRIYDAETLDHINVSNGEVSEAVSPDVGQCFQTIRRGVEATRIQVNCPDGTTRRHKAILSDIVEIGANLVVNGEVTACKSLHDLTILDSEWQTFVTVGQNKSAAEGSFTTVPNDWTGHPQSEEIIKSEVERWYLPEDVNLLNRVWASLHYNGTDIFAVRWNRRFSLPLEGYTAAQFRATISCIPVSVAGDESAILIADTTIFFNLTGDKPATCEAEACKVLRPPKPRGYVEFAKRCFAKK